MAKTEKREFVPRKWSCMVERGSESAKLLAKAAARTLAELEQMQAQYDEVEPDVLEQARYDAQQAAEWASRYTLKSAQKEVKGIARITNSGYGDYRVRLIGRTSEASTYYTAGITPSDLEDAVQTALAMHEEREEMRDADQHLLSVAVG